MRVNGRAARLTAIAVSTGLAASLGASIASPAQGAPTAIKSATVRALPAGPILSIGMFHPAVRTLQTGLGMPMVTGYFGPLTEQYVKALQRSAKIKVTGIVNKPTWKQVGRRAVSVSGTAVTTRAPVRGKSVVSIAASLQGIPYRANGNSPRTGFNCSSYTQYVYQQIGINLGGPYTVWQYNRSRHIKRSQAKPGDLVFFYNYPKNFIGHVGIYAGNNEFWGAPYTGKSVRKGKIYTNKVLFGRVL